MRLQSSDSPPPITFVEYRGEIVRSVEPYVHLHRTNCKKRWIGEKIIDVLSREFLSHSVEYFIEAIRSGNIKVSGKIVSESHVLQAGDVITHAIHRHEPYVSNDTIYLLPGSSANVVALLKPSGTTVHSSGSHHHSCLISLASTEGCVDIGAKSDAKVVLRAEELHSCHRLDRLTTGITIFGKTKEASARITSAMMSDRMRKRYILLVEGEFPVDPEQRDETFLEEMEDGTRLLRTLEGSSTRFATLDTFGSVPQWLGSISVEDHAVPVAVSLLALSPLPISGSSDPHGGLSEGNHACSWISRFVPRETNAYWGSLAPQASSEGVFSPNIISNAEYLQSARHCLSWTSDGFLDVRVPLQTAEHSLAVCKFVVPSRCQPEQAADTDREGTRGGGTEARKRTRQEGQDALEANDTSPKEGPKQARTLFRRICIFRNASGRHFSLVEARPITGRTHQIRLHAGFLGHPICNDPVYNEVAASRLFGGKAESSEMSRSNFLDASGRRAATGVVRGPASDPVIALCNVCNNGYEAEYNALQRLSSGIFLHSCEYACASDVQGADCSHAFEWVFQAPLPAWAKLALISSFHQYEGK